MSRPAANRIVADRYALRAHLGRGGMGVVWRAHDSVLGREVAVKEVVFPPTMPDDERRSAQARVMREARAAARLNHPGVVTLYDVVQDHGGTFIVMELVNAPTLADLVRVEGPLPADRVAKIGGQVASALEAAHRAGIVHRDVKPGNVMVPETSRAKLADFGVASLQGDPQLTSTGLVIGSPAYMAPEQARGEESGPPVDFWALGATMFYAVEGEPPFDRATSIATLAAVVNEEPRSPRLAGPLTPLLMALLAKDPQARPSGPELRAELGRLRPAIRPAPPTEVLPAHGPGRTVPLPTVPAQSQPAAAPTDAPAPAPTDAQTPAPTDAPAPAPTPTHEGEPPAGPAPGDDKTPVPPPAAEGEQSAAPTRQQASPAGARSAPDRPGGPVVPPAAAAGTPTRGAATPAAAAAQAPAFEPARDPAPGPADDPGSGRTWEAATAGRPARPVLPPAPPVIRSGPGRRAALLALLVVAGLLAVLVALTLRSDRDPATAPSTSAAGGAATRPGTTTGRATSTTGASETTSAPTTAAGGELPEGWREFTNRRGSNRVGVPPGFKAQTRQSFNATVVEEQGGARRVFTVRSKNPANPLPQASRDYRAAAPGNFDDFREIRYDENQTYAGREGAVVFEYEAVRDGRRVHVSHINFKGRQWGYNVEFIVPVDQWDASKGLASQFEQAFQPLG
jgi:serine/threonine protein kinase